ncbi:MAG: glycosyltransferase family 2 protein, partial [Bdellovibrionales bacterium]|nr:glycosyltransferase family 2 protein [Bdellovibrionales bacterium]
MANSVNKTDRPIPLNSSPSSDVAEELERKQQHISNLLEQIRILNQQKKYLEETLEEVTNSKSWKLTAPLRWFFSFKKKLFPLWRYRVRKIELRPVRNIEENENIFSIVGPSPYFELFPTDGGTMPSGWVKISAKLKSELDHLFFYLYFRSGREYREDYRSWITLENAKLVEAIVPLPAVVKGLRLDPFEKKGSFSFETFEIIELGNIQLYSAILKQHLKQALMDPRLFLKKLKKAFRVFQEGGFHAVRMRIFKEDFTQDYQKWVEQYDTLSDQDRIAIKENIDKLTIKPTFSVIMPTFNTPEIWLRKAIESVKKQLYSNWEFCIADDASKDPRVREVLEEYAASDPRIKISFRKSNGHISAASNTALELATGDFVVLLDHDDELSEHALFMLASNINQFPDSQIFYSDEDKINVAGVRHLPYFKPDFNPELLLSQNYICHLTVIKKSLIDSIGGFRQGFDGAQDWDLVLRAIDEVGWDRVKHIPFVLYHWRVIEGSTAQSTAFKPYVMEAQQKTVSDHLKRNSELVRKVEINESISQLRVKFDIPNPKPLVSIIIPTRDRLSFLERCIESIYETTEYENFEIIIVDNASKETETKAYFEKCRARGDKVLHDEGEFNFSRLNNQAAKEANGKILAFLNNDLEVINNDWLTEMVSYAVRKQIGAVGSRLYFPNDLIQHAGVVLGIGGVAGHSHKGKKRDDVGYWNRVVLPSSFSAVTAACMLVRKDVFMEAGGFDEETLAVAFNDVDLCIRIRELGYRNVYTPYAELYHYESASRGHETTPEKFVRFENEIEKMKKRWGKLLEEDPC